MIKHPGKTDVVEIRDRILDKGVTVRRVRDPNDSGAQTASALRGPEDARLAMQSIRESLPDLRLTIESALTVGDDVLVSWRAMPSEVVGCTVTRLQGRKIAHTWTYAPNRLRSKATELR